MKSILPYINRYTLILLLPLNGYLFNKTAASEALLVGFILLVSVFIVSKINEYISKQDYGNYPLDDHDEDGD